MFPIMSKGKLYKNSNLIILFMIIAFSCKKNDLVNDFPSKINFDISGRLLEEKGYCWFADNSGPSPVLYVFDGKSWSRSPYHYPDDDYITSIETDSDNNIWIGTYKNGIFIINQ